MALRFGVLAFLFVGLCFSPACGDEMPYTGYINADDVYVRSGPGKNYYPTLKLGHGDEVEVYRHDPGGWYAIRPPEGSFSWVSGKFLEPVEDSIARTTGDRVLARVGSQFSDIRDVIQVRMHRGEELEVLEAKRFGSGPGTQVWYKIAPPAGEFRWVYGKFVDREKTLPDEDDSDTRRNLLIDEDGLAYGEEDQEDDDSDEEDEAILIPGMVRKTHADVNQAGYAEDAERESIGERESHATADGRNEGIDEESDSLEVPNAARQESGWTADDFDAEIVELELQLGAMVAEEPTVWDFTELTRRAEIALDYADSAVERGKAKKILRKIERFEDIKQRHREVTEITVRTDRRNARLTREAADLRQQAEPRYEDSDRYDGSGWLVRVVTRRVGAPPYALVDAGGTIQTYVSPAPGTNLRSYVGRQIGINGKRGFAADYNTQHLTAKRITVLDGQAVRY